MKIWLNECDTVNLYDYQEVFANKKLGLISICAMFYTLDKDNDVLINLIDKFNNGVDLFLDVADFDENAKLVKIKDIVVKDCNLTKRNDKNNLIYQFVTFVF